MSISLKKIHHLIRYFVLIGIIVFIAYIKHWQDDIFLILIGPSIFLAYNARQTIGSLITLPDSEMVNYLAFLMPLCLLYFGLLGFQLKQLWNERGKIRFLSLFAMIVFILYVHYASWKNLAPYFITPRPPSVPAPSLYQHAVSNEPLGNNEGQTLSV